MATARETLSAEPLLSGAEETELAEQIEAGVLAREAAEGGRDALGASELELVLLQERGERARQRYIRANLRLVAQLSGQAAVRTGLPESDLFQEGCLGLIGAVERFDGRRGYKFSTYASYWVRAAVGAATASSLGALNVPSSRAGQLRSARGVEAELTQSFGRSATVGEVAVALGRSEDWTAALLAQRAPQSLEGLQAGGLDLPAEAGAWGEVRLEHDRPGAELLFHLPGLEREVLGLRFGFTDGSEHSYAEISRLLVITASKARRLERKALDALRGSVPAALLPTSEGSGSWSRAHDRKNRAVENTGWWTKARGMPKQVHGAWQVSLAGQPGRQVRVLAWATTESGAAVASPSALSFSDDADGWTHLGWHQIERGGWDEETGALTWQLYDQTSSALTLTEPGRLPEVFRERVAASIVLEQFVPIRNGRGVLISGRRDLADGDVTITWNTSLQRGLSWQMEGVRAAVDEAVAQVRTEYDMG